MFRSPSPPTPLEDRGPLRVMFVITSMPVGGAETLTAELIRRLDRSRFAPELCCLKYFDTLGESLADEVPSFTGLLSWKYDVTVLRRLTRLLKERRIDAVITIGTGGDKMFWGRLAAWRARVPVICSALHSTGLPDRVEWQNRLLTPITDAFIAVAEPHGQYLTEHEGCPAGKVRVIPNGVDLDRFAPRWPSDALREELGLKPRSAATRTPLVGIVAALRPEKNHALFLETARRIRRHVPEAMFLIIGDGPQRERLEAMARELSLQQSVRFLGTRSDVPDVLAALDVVMLTSHMEGNPLAVLEAMAAEKPVVTTRVGSIPEAVVEGQTGYLAAPGAADELAARVVELLTDPDRAAAMGRAGREQVIARWSLARTVEGYEQLIDGIYRAKATGRGKSDPVESRPFSDRAAT